MLILQDADREVAAFFKFLSYFIAIDYRYDSTIIFPFLENVF